MEHVHAHKESIPKFSKPIKTDDKLEGVDAWYRNFIKEVKTDDNELLFELALAANTLKIESLLELCSAAIYQLFATPKKARYTDELITIEKMREIFGVEDDFTEEERERNLREMALAEKAFGLEVRPKAQ